VLPLYFPLRSSFIIVCHGSRAVDNYSGQSYEHSRAWVERRMLFSSSVFAIDICAYAVMSNHVHMVFYVEVKQMQLWFDNNMAQRWHMLHKSALLTQMFVRGDILSQGQRVT
jgi:REP element-mobilizing transposase RayT